MADFKETKNWINKQIMRRRWLGRTGLFDTQQKTWLTHHGNKLFVDMSDQKGPSYHVVSWGIETYEKPNLEFLFRYFSRKPDGTFLDIGANIGIFSFLLAQKYKNLVIHAFEPEPTTFSSLRSTFDVEFFPHVHCHALGLSDTSGVATFFADKNNHGGHSLHQQAIVDEGNETQQTEVPVITLDSFVKTFSLKTIDVIKLDVQQHESHVLRGGIQTIREHRPVVLMECYFNELLDENKPLLKPFYDLNYKVVIPETFQILDLEKETLQRLRNGHRPYIDLALVPQEKCDFFKE